MVACGFDAVEAGLLNVQLAAVLEWFLERWDGLAVDANNVGPGLEYFVGQDLAQEAALKVAALCTRYPLWHIDLLLSAPYWQGPGIRGALNAMQASCPPGRAIREKVKRASQPSDRVIYEEAKIAKNTFKDLRNGAHLPVEENVLRLAKAFSALDAQGPRGARSEAELRFSLRLACLAAEVRQQPPWGAAASEAFSFFGQMFLFFLGILRDEPDKVLNDLVAHGRSSQAWPRVSLQFHGACLQILFAGMNNLHQRQMAALPDLRKPVDREEVLRWLAAEMEHHANLSVFPSWMPMSNPYQTFAEDSAALFRSLAEGRSPPPPRQTPEELESFSLYLQAVDPWREFRPGEREELLRRSVEVCPESADARVRFAMAIGDGEGQRAAAIQELEAAMVRDPSRAAGGHHLASMLLEERRFEDTLAATKRHLAHHPEDGTAHGIQGRALLALGHPEQALVAVDKALKLNLRVAWIFGLRARCQRALGDEKGARESDRQAELYRAGSLRPSAEESKRPPR